MKTLNLGDICEVVTKGTTPTTLGMKLNEGNVNFIKVECLSEDGQIVWEKIQNIDEITHSKLKRSQLQVGDILFSIAGSIGRMAIVTEDLLPANTNQAVAILRPKVDLVDTDFLFYFLRDAKSQGDARKRIVQSVQNNLSLGELASLSISLPSRTTQVAISSFMRILDKKISLNRSISKTLEDLAQTIYKSWFIDFDPVKAKMAGDKPVGMDVTTAAMFPDSMEDSELGPIPIGWTDDSMAELFGLQGGFSFKSSSWTENGVPVIKIGSVKPGLVDLSQVSYVDEELAEKTSPAYRLPRGSLVIGLTGYVGEVGLIKQHPEIPLLNQRVAKFLPVNGTWKIPFIYCLTRKPEFKQRVIDAANGSAQQNVSNAQILSLRTVVPPIGLIESFNDQFESLFDQILLLAEQNDKLAQLRDSLLPRLISGELRIPEEMLVS